MDETEQDAAQWDARYAGGPPPWDLRGPPPVLLRLIEDQEQSGLHVLVPCAGLGHDAIAWARAGHQVVAVDFASRAVQGAREQASKAGVPISVLQRDLFSLSGEFSNRFDLVWEQTCLAAIPPARREDYFRLVSAALKEGGRFIGLLWHHGRPGGPPYDMSPEMIQGLVPSELKLEGWDWVQDSVPSRPNEFMIRYQKTPASR